MTNYLYLKNSKHKGGIVIENGLKFYNRNSQLHREDGPAIILKDGTKKWYLNNNLHRENGPAILRKDGSRKWFLNGKQVTEKEVMGKKEYTKQNMKKDIEIEEILKKYL